MSSVVTVVIPAFNAADTIHEALDSLKVQTRRDWDAIVVDDGSTDGTAEVVEAYGDPRVRLIRQENGGASAARNAGLTQAKGEWILFLDADDWIAPNFFEKMLRTARRKRADAVYCGYNRVRPNGERVPQDWEEDVAADPFRSFSRGCPVVVHGIIVRRRLLQDVGGFDTDLITCEDWDLWQKVARTGAKFVGIPDILAFYRLRDGSLSTSAVQMLHDGLKVTSRSWGPDPRVPNPAPHLKDGRNGDNLDGSPGYYLCWCAGEFAAQGGDCSALIDSLDLLPAIPDRSDQLSAAIFDGIHAAGRIRAAEELIHARPAIERNLAGFLQGLERKTARRHLARRILTGLKAQMAYEETNRPTTADVSIDIRDFQAIIPPPGVDTLRIKFQSGHKDVGDTQAPVWGPLSREDVARIALKTLYLRPLLREGTLLKDPKFWTHLGLAGLKSSKRLARNLLRAPDRRRALKGELMSLVHQAASRTFGAPVEIEGSSAAQARRLITEIEQAANRHADQTGTSKAAAKPAGESADPTSDPKAFFERVFETEDPWSYSNPYETLKYEQTLALLPAGPIGRAMEVACAEGHFTLMLAPRVERLLAVDIAETAVVRAKARCAALDNIDYAQFNLIDDTFPEDLDLIVCSEVLYYLEDEKKLAKVAARMSDALKPGGLLLMAHAFQLSDDAERTGFDWGDAYGGQTISDVFEATAGLKLERALETDLYRINLFRKETPGQAVAPAVIERGPIADELDLEVERYVVWGGAKARRGDLEAERTTSIPVLCYHRVAVDGPADLADYRVTPAEFGDQMRLLRRYGYHAITAETLAQHLATAKPFRGRPVLITFDDGYQDFADSAWPILRKHDFTAQVFIVTDKVAGQSDWDAQYGPTAPLMDWPTIQRLHAEGCLFGSHLATHRSAETLTPDELLREAAGSNAALEARLGEPVRAIAAPFGIYDDRLSYILELCGYKIAFTTEEKIATVYDDALSMPRIEVLGGTDLQTFADSIGLELEDGDLENTEGWLGVRR
jgi:peptidoglycan/xylan/chitin deacetylase (PgdA/CDA1 family)/predicted TPR repeat methyltransferase